MDYIIFFNLLSHPPRLHICFRLRKSKDGKLPKLPKTKKEALKIGVPEVYKSTEESGPFLEVDSNYILEFHNLFCLVMITLFKFMYLHFPDSVLTSVVDPDPDPDPNLDPDPLDPRIFGPPRSGSSKVISRKISV